MALGNHLSIERIRVFGTTPSSLLAHIKSPAIALINRKPHAINDRSNQTKMEGVPLVLTFRQRRQLNQSVRPVLVGIVGLIVVNLVLFVALSRTLA